MRLLRQYYPECITIFVTAPPADLVERIRERRDEHMNAASLAQRLEIAREQIAAAKEFNYIIFNKEGQLFDTIRGIELIIRAERMRVRGDVDLQAAIPHDEFDTAADSAV
jgi:guanylate kinase